MFIVLLSMVGFNIFVIMYSTWCLQRGGFKWLQNAPQSTKILHTFSEDGRGIPLYRPVECTGYTKYNIFAPYNILLQL